MEGSSSSFSNFEGKNEKYLHCMADRLEHAAGWLGEGWGVRSEGATLGSSC